MSRSKSHASNNAQSQISECLMHVPKPSLVYCFHRMFQQTFPSTSFCPLKNCTSPEHIPTRSLKAHARKENPPFSGFWVDVGKIVIAGYSNIGISQRFI